MSKEIDDTRIEVYEKILKDADAVALLRINEFMQDEVRFLQRQIDRLKSQISSNRLRLAEKYPETNQFSWFWFWNPIEQAFLTDKQPDRKNVFDYIGKYIEKVKKK